MTMRNLVSVLVLSLSSLFVSACGLPPTDEVSTKEVGTKQAALEACPYTPQECCWSYQCNTDPRCFGPLGQQFQQTCLDSPYEICLGGDSYYQGFFMWC